MERRTFVRAELAAAACVQPRTVRHWIRIHLVPPPIGRGRYARYDENHLLRRIANDIYRYYGPVADS